MDVRLLGSTEVVAGQARLILGGPRQRAVLADLALEAGTTVLTRQLVHDIWGESPPATADHTIEAYVSRLRRVLHLPDQPRVLLTVGSGYQLDMSRDEIDVFRFSTFAARGRAAFERHDAQAAELRLSSALSLWRGRALGDLRDAAFAPIVASRLEDDRLAVLEMLIDARLELGRHRELISELETAVGSEPYRERFYAQLMMALYRSGRQADALSVYQRARALFASELGLEPGRELRELETAILVQAPHLEPATSSAGVPARALDPPRRESRPVAPAETAAAETAAANRAAAEKAQAGRSSRPWRARARRYRTVAIWAIVAVVLVVGAVWRSHEAGSARPQAAAASGAVSELSAAHDALARTAALPADPGAVVAGDGALWVSSPEAHALYRLNPSSGRIEASITVGAGAGAVAIAGSDIWVANALDDTVSRISTRSNKVIQTVHTGSEPTGLAPAGGRLWVTDELASSMSPIDVANGRLGPSRPLGSAPFDVAAGAGSLWITSPRSDTVIRVDAAGNGPGVQIGVGAGPTAATFGLGSLWVANSLDSTVTRIDPATDAVASTIPVGDGPDALAVVGKTIWVANRLSSTLSVLNPITDTMTRSIALPASPISLAAEGSRVWTATQPAGINQPANGILHVVQSSAITSIDPAVAFPDMPFQFAAGTYDTLVTYARVGGSAGMQLVPDLALAMPTITAGGTAYTFVLRPGLRYSDGVPVRPADFAYAIERVLELNATGSSFLTGIVGATRCTQGAPCHLGAGITTSAATDSVTFHLTTADPTFLNKLAFGFAAPVPATTPTHDTGTAPVPSTGPYMISRYQPGRLVEFTRNPYFVQWSAAAEPTGSAVAIRWTFGASLAMEAAEINSGQADWTDDNLPDVAGLLHRSPRQVHVNPGFVIDYAAFNTRVPPFNQLRVRRAFSLAADRNALVNQLGGPSAANPTCQILPPGIPGYRSYCPFTVDPSSDGAWHGPDLAAARTLIAESGTAGMRVTVWSQSYNQTTGAFIVSVLRELGYRATIVTPSATVLSDEVNDSRKRAQATDGIWGADYPSASDFFDTFFRCSDFRLADPAATADGSFFCDPTVDTKMNLADRQQMTDPNQAAMTWSAVDRAVTDQAPWVPLVNLTWADYLSARVSNYQYNPAVGILLDQLYIRHK